MHLFLYICMSVYKNIQWARPHKNLTNHMLLFSISVETIGNCGFCYVQILGDYFFVWAYHVYFLEQFCSFMTVLVYFKKMFALIIVQITHYKVLPNTSNEAVLWTLRSRIWKGKYKVRVFIGWERHIIHVYMQIALIGLFQGLYFQRDCNSLTV